MNLDDSKWGPRQEKLSQGRLHIRIIVDRITLSMIFREPHMIKNSPIQKSTTKR